MMVKKWFNRPLSVRRSSAPSSSVLSPPSSARQSIRASHFLSVRPSPGRITDAPNVVLKLWEFCIAAASHNNPMQWKASIKLQLRVLGIPLRSLIIPHNSYTSHTSFTLFETYLQTFWPSLPQRLHACDWHGVIHDPRDVPNTTSSLVDTQNVLIQLKTTCPFFVIFKQRTTKWGCDRVYFSYHVAWWFLGSNSHDDRMCILGHCPLANHLWMSTGLSGYKHPLVAYKRARAHWHVLKSRTFLHIFLMWMLSSACGRIEMNVYVFFAQKYQVTLRVRTPKTVGLTLRVPRHESRRGIIKSIRNGNGECTFCLRDQRWGHT